MKKLLTATTALALVGGAAFAEMTMSGSAELGLDYNSDPAAGEAKHKFVHEVGIAFSGSATTDGGLTFGASVGFESKDTDVNEGSVSVSGTFGTLSIGDVGRASELAGGIADVGLNGIGVDDVVEDMRETSAKQINYSNSFGAVSIAVSAGTAAGTAAVAGTPAVEAKDGFFGYALTGSTNILGDGTSAQWLYHAPMALHSVEPLLRPMLSTRHGTQPMLPHLQPTSPPTRLSLTIPEAPPQQGISGMPMVLRLIPVMWLWPVMNWQSSSITKSTMTSGTITLSAVPIPKAGPKTSMFGRLPPLRLLHLLPPYQPLPPFPQWPVMTNTPSA